MNTRGSKLKAGALTGSLRCEDRIVQHVLRSGFATEGGHAEPALMFGSRNGVCAPPKLLRCARYFCFLFSALCFGAFAQYSINRSTIDGGNGSSTGGVCSVSGSTNPVVVPATLPTQFYRLHKP